MNFMNFMGSFIALSCVSAHLSDKAFVGLLRISMGSCITMVVVRLFLSILNPIKQSLNPDLPPFLPLIILRGRLKGLRISNEVSTLE